MTIGNAKFNEDQILEAYKKLPESLQQTLFSSDVTNHIFEAGRIQGLNVENIGELADAVGLVIMGLLRPEELVSAISDITGGDSSKAFAIAQYINQKIFLPLREEFKKIKRDSIAQENTPEKLPTIFAKNIPPLSQETYASSVTSPKRVAESLSPDAAKQELEKLLNRAPENKTISSGYQDKPDPYRESLD